MVVVRAVVLGVLLVATLVSAVDRNNFKKCQDSSFCRRNRNIPENQTPFIAKTDPELDGDTVKVTLQNTQTNKEFIVSFDAYGDATGRVRINEKDPLKPRYQVQDVVNPELKVAHVHLKHGDPDAFYVTFGNDCAVAVSYKPFRVDFLRNNAVVVSLNSRGLMNFEHYREKQEGDEDGMWEEEFKTHKDTKPHGPASVGMDISFPGARHVYGIPEHAHDVSLKPTRGSEETEPYRLYNLDVFEYELQETMALYGSIPYMLAHTAQQTSGVLLLNSAEMWIDVAKKETSSVNKWAQKLSSFITGTAPTEEQPQVDTHWMAESGIIDLFVFLGPSPKEVFNQYALVTGFSPLPPLFSIAYHQCRWNYNDEQDVKTVATQFDEFDIPFDIIWLDIEHTDGKRYMTWDTAKFPNSIDMQNTVASKGRKMVNIVDPHIKRVGGYHVHEQAEKLGYYIKDRDGKDYDGWCWPGSSSWLDFMDPKIRSWWADMLDPQHYQGTTLNMYFWNDMNEPSVFNGPEITMHKDAKHYGGWEHRDVHNIYGMWQQASTAEGIKRRSGGVERPFVLSRAFFAGSQKYGAIWTGDNVAAWDHLEVSIPMLLSMSVAGLPFVGADMGGFFGNPEPELLVRWYQAGSYQPFMRAHAHLDTKRREPYLLEERERGIVRDAVRGRYQLLPFWYTQFYLTEQTGTPVMRPTWVEFPSDTETFAEQSAHMLGDSLLVAPVLKQGHTTKEVYFPKGADWFEYPMGSKFHGGSRATVPAPLDKTPVFQRAGSIVPRRMRVRRSSKLTTEDPFSLFVAADTAGSAQGQLYVDDTHTFEYQEKNAFVLRNFTLTHEGGAYTFTSRAADGSGVFATTAWIERLVLYGVGRPHAVSCEGINLEFHFNSNTQVLEVKKPWTKSVTQDFSITIYA
eukprot:m.174061 g.174061  ORF g.174061 m.174061 type:complete len:906 (+) comp16750_c0_seq2:34-2751(+)